MCAVSKTYSEHLTTNKIVTMIAGDGVQPIMLGLLVTQQLGTHTLVCGVPGWETAQLTFSSAGVSQSHPAPLTIF